MLRLALVFSLGLTALSGLAQASTQAPTTDAFALSPAQKSVAALTGGSSVSDITLNANVSWIVGSDNETGAGTFEAKGTKAASI
jgi:hypothetical protein